MPNDNDISLPIAAPGPALHALITGSPCAGTARGHGSQLPALISVLQAQTVTLPLLQLPESSGCCWPSRGQNPSRLRVPGPLPRARARGEVGAQRLVQVRQFRVVFARALQTLLNQEHTLTETESGGGWGELAFFFFF